MNMNTKALALLSALVLTSTPGCALLRGVVRDDQVQSLCQSYAVSERFVASSIYPALDAISVFSPEVAAVYRGIRLILNPVNATILAQCSTISPDGATVRAQLAQATRASLDLVNLYKNAPKMEPARGILKAEQVPGSYIDDAELERGQADLFLLLQRLR